MKLYEAITGKEGASYQRCYVWAVNDDHAQTLFREQHPTAAPPLMVLLMTSEAQPFCTKLSSEGWEV